uniref:Uncharacterized protein n=1 Tax=Trichuris muris TaxID=70415 RepID=A0A5S6QKY6_TRIMR
MIHQLNGVPFRSFCMIGIPENRLPVRTPATQFPAARIVNQATGGAEVMQKSVRTRHPYWIKHILFNNQVDGN